MKAKVRKTHSKRSVMRTVFHILFLVVISAVIGMSVYSINARMSGDSIPMPFGCGVAVVKSGSMEPRLSVGDLVVIKETDSFEVDDIVVYQDGRMPVIHRIIGIHGDSVTTKGDFNNYQDEPIDISLIKGKMMFSVPFVGTVTDFIKTPLGILVVIAIAVIALETSYKREKKRDATDIDKIKKEIEALKKFRDETFYVETLKEDLNELEQKYADPSTEGDDTDEEN